MNHNNAKAYFCLSVIRDKEEAASSLRRPAETDRLFPETSESDLFCSIMCPLRPQCFKGTTEGLTPAVYLHQPINSSSQERALIGISSSFMEM